MGKVKNRKAWACLLVIAMVTSTFVGFSTIVWGTSNSPDGLMKSIPNIEFVELDGKQPVNDRILNMNYRYQKDIESLSPSPGPEPLGTFNYDFDTDTVGQLPSDPPWSYVDTPAGQAVAFGPDDFEDDVVGEKPDSPPWTSTDGLSATYYWLENFESYTIGQDLSGGVISGSLGYFGTFDPAATLTAEPPPAGAPAGTVLPGIDTGTMAAYFVDAGGGSYWGPAGVDGPATTQGYMGGWIYCNAMMGLRFDLLLIDMATMSTAIEIALWNDNNIYHWPGGAYTQIPGITWTVGTWHEVFAQYDDVAGTYSVWWDGVEYVAGSAFTAGPTDIDAMVWFGDGTNDVYIDNFCHMWPPTGLTDRCQVVNTEAHSGAQSVFLDQNNEAAPEMVRMVANFDPPMAGVGTWDYWLRTDSAIADTNGAVAAFLDQSDSPVIEIRANGGNFEYNDGGAWQIAQAFAADTWYQFTIDFDTIAKTYNLAIDTIPSGAGAFARESGTLTAVRYAGTSGTQSEHYIDDVDVSCAGAAANITVSNMVSNSAPNALRFQEFNAGGPGYIGADQLGAGIGAVGNFSFWFYSTENWGGQMWTLADVNGGSTMTVFSMGVNLATLEGIPGETHFVDNDGTGNWVVPGPTYNANEWHEIGIIYDCLNTSHSGSTGTFYYTWDGGAPQGPYGMIGAAGYIDFLVCDGGATDTYGDFFYDDFSLSLNAMPGPPTNCWAEIPGPTGAEVFGNYTVDQDNPVEGTVTNDYTDVGFPPDGSTEDIREDPFGDIPTWVNYSTNQDNPDHGTVTGTEANTHGPGTESIEEIVPGGSTFSNYSTDMDIPVEGTVAGNEANTHGPGTEDITEFLAGGDIFTNYTVDMDFPIQGIVTNDYTFCGFPPDGSTENIQEVFAAGATTDIFTEGFEDPAWPPPGWTHIQFNAAETWKYETFDPHGGVQYVNCLYDPALNQQDEWLITPAMDLSAYSNLVLSFWWYGSYAWSVSPNDNCDLQVWISTDGGATFPTQVWDENGLGVFTDWTWYNTSMGTPIDLSAYDGEPNLAIGFQYWGLDGAEFAVDDVLLIGDLPPGYSAEHHWRTESISAGADTLDLFVTARTNTGTDDTFTIGYSTAEAGPYTPTTIVVNSDSMTTYTAALPNTLSGQIYLSVIDDTTGDAAQQDTVEIDAIRIQHYVYIPYYYSLEHRWRTEAIIPGQNTLTLYVDAATTVGSDDSFTIGYSTVQAGPYTPVITVNSDMMQTYSGALPPSLSGQIYLNVIDDNDADSAQQDSVIVDTIRIAGIVGSSLEHRWRIDAIDPDVSTLTLYVTARTTTGSDDTFTFGYSFSLPGPYTPTTIVVNSDTMVTYSANIPVMTSLYLNVIDDNITDTVLDTIIIDTIRVQAVIPSGTITHQVATADNPDHGTVTGTFALTTSIPPDGAAQQIEEIDLGKKKATTPPSPSCVNPAEPRSYERNLPTDMGSGPQDSLSTFVFNPEYKYQPLPQASRGSGVIPLSPGPGPQPSAQVYYTDRPTFDADGGAALPIEDWEASTIGVGAIAGMQAPLDEFTNNAYFQPGDVLPGIRVEDDPLNGAADGLVTVGAGFAGNPTKVVATNTFADSGWFIFDDPAYPCNAFGGELQSYLNPTTFDIEIYGVGGVLLDSLTAPADNTGIFWGVISDEQIESIHFTSATETEGADNIAFGEILKGNSLQHNWTMEPQPAGSTTRTLYVTARTDVATNESFIFGYSNVSVGGPWTDLFTVDGNSDVFQTYSAPLPTNFSGPMWVCVYDADNKDDDPVNVSSIFVDTIRVYNDNSIAPEYSLEHRWRTENIPIGAQTLDLIVTARTNTGADDSFIFGYSTALGGPYTPTTLVVNSDVMTTYTASLPYTLTGQIYLNVIDSSSDFAFGIDTIYIDAIRLEYFSPGGALAQQVAIMDNFVWGSVTGTYTMTNSIPPDGTRQQIQEVALKKKGISDPSPFAPGPGPEPMVDILIEGFEVWPPAGWTQIDNDGDGEIWMQSDPVSGSGEPPHNGTYDAHSASYINGVGPLTPDNFLITPQIDLSMYMNTQLIWWDCTQDPAWPAEHYEIWVSTTGNAIGDFTDQVYEDTLVDDTWRMRVLDLSAYDFQQIYIAWRHNEVTDMYQMKIDDVHIQANLGGNSLEHIWTFEDMPANSLTRTLYVDANYNTGSNDDFIFGWSRDIAGPYTPLITVNSDTPTTYSASIPVNFNGPIYVNVIDANAGDLAGLDSIYVDMLYVDSFVSFGSTSIDLHWDLSSDDYIGTYEDNFTVDQDNPVQGTVTNDYTNVDEIAPPDGLTEDIEEIFTGDIWLNYTVDMDIPVEGNVAGSYLDIDEIDPPDGNFEDIQEVMAAGSVTIWSDDFEDGDISDWTLGGASNDWEVGTPGGLGGDPGSAAGGLYSIGNDLTGLGATPGEYENNLALDSNYVVSPVINCAAYSDIVVEFQRWLGVESSTFDHAYLEVSNDGTSWTTIWQNGATMDDAAWIFVQYDISAIADFQPTVYVRFELGDTDGSVTYEGWNIDDIAVRSNPTITIFNDDFEDGDFSDWTLGGASNDWEIGTPGGLGGDPSSAAGGTYSIGNDLTGLGATPGEYENNLALDSNYIVSPVINCVGYTGVNLGFNRWLGVESSTYDHAYLEVSNDGTSWTTVWQNGGTMDDAAWVSVSYDVSAVADNQPTVYVRFELGDTDGSVTYEGWNIDDVTLSAVMPPGYSLAHQWRTESIATGATSLDLYVRARRTPGADDNFLIGYSTTQPGPYTPVINVNVDPFQTYSASLPNTLSGPIYLNVIDSVTGEAAPQDAIRIDLIRIQYYQAVGPHHSLEHIWRTEAIPPLVSSITLNVTARINVGADDAFRFEYATVLAGPYTPTTLTVNSDTMQTYTAPLPSTLTGPFYLRVVDDNSADAAQMDTVYIDTIRLEFNGFIPGPGENDIVAYNVYRADEEDGDDITGPYEHIGSAPAGTDIYVDAGEGLDMVNQAWYYVEAEDFSGQVNPSGYFSKLNYAPVTSNVMADGVAPRLFVGPFTPIITITADAFDDSSNYEAIPKMDRAEMFVDVDPGEGNGIPIGPADGFWGNDTTEALSGPIDFSTYDIGVYEVYVRTGEDHTLGAMGSVVWGPPENVTIEVVDSPPIADAGPDQTVPQHTLVLFDGSLSTDDVGITNYWWNFTDVPGPQTLTGVAPSYTFDFEGLYNVTLTVMDRMGQTDSDDMIVNVTDGDPPVADAGPDQQDIPAAIITFDGTASFDPGHLGEPIIDGIVNWTWNFTDGGPVTLFGPNPTHQFNTPGVYVVTLTVTDASPAPGPWTDTDTMNVTIIEIYDIDITEAMLSDDWILISFPNKVEGDPITLIVDEVDEIGGGAGYVQWDVVQWFDPQSAPGSEWKTTATYKPPFMNTFNYVNNSMGFWIHITDYGDGNLTMGGPLAITGEDGYLYLYTGWNLVGYPFSTLQLSVDTFGSSFEIDDMYCYDSTDPYRLRFYDWWGAELHEPGKGYWAHVNNDEVLWMGAP